MMRKSAQEFDREMIGLEGYSDPSYKDVELPYGMISKIKVCIDEDTKALTGLEFINERGDATKVTTNQGAGKWHEFIL
jgi:hypothetical protein